MKIGLVDVDGHNFPNIPLMKLSGWHKANGDSVEWYSPVNSGHMDVVYLSKIFSFSTDYGYFIDAEKIIKGGSGYCIDSRKRKEIFCKERDVPLSPEVEHFYPDYGLYPGYTKDTAFGFLSRGCPRGCEFCHVHEKEGGKAYKVADLAEFWRGQKEIVLLDPNLLACSEWEDLMWQLIESKSRINFSQGLDIRLLSSEKTDLLKRMRIKQVHFAWDRYEDLDLIVPRLKEFARQTGWGSWKMGVYVLVNFDTTLAQDLERIYILRDLGYAPYVMIYKKETLLHGHVLLRLQQWTNNRFIFASCKRFEDFR